MAGISASPAIPNAPNAGCSRPVNIFTRIFWRGGEGGEEAGAVPAVLLDYFFCNKIRQRGFFQGFQEFLFLFNEYRIIVIFRKFSNHLYMSFFLFSYRRLFLNHILKFYQYKFT